MSIANWCVLIACLLPVLTIAPAKIYGARTSPKDGGYNNNRPRDWAATLTGWQKRAVAAHNNSFEALPLFIAAVVLAQQAHGNQTQIDYLAIAFIILRIIYAVTYLMNKGAIRSLVWMAGTAVSIAIFFTI